MEKIVIEGGIRLEGEVEVSGAKNAALPIFTATLLAPGPFRLGNIPNLRDTVTIIKILESLGVKIEKLGEGEYEVDGTGLCGHETPYDLVKTMRASCLTLGPLLARTGKAKVSLPGGCAIGERPIDQHLKGLEALGAKIDISHGYVKASVDGRLKGARIIMDLVTVTGVMNIMMAATLAEGKTVIENAAREPEIVALAKFLTAMGAKINGAGSSIITIDGVESLHHVDFDNIPDRIEAGTFMAAAAITGGDITVTGVVHNDLHALTEKLKEAGCEITEAVKSVRVQGPDKIRPIHVTTAPFPGFPTDMQAQIMAVMALADGASIITETIFENRFMHVAELWRMGADITVNGSTSTVCGVRSLSGADVMATDLRASASLLLAGLAAKGVTRIDRIYHLQRGYERIERKLGSLGAIIRRE